MFRKTFICAVLIAFSFSCFNPIYAGSLYSNLPAPGTPVQLSLAFKPVMLQGIKIDPKNPLHFDFIIDTGDGLPNDQTVRAETLKLVRYFLASLTVPNDQLWVNLSPYEKNRIIPDGLALTEMGGELLAQDYILKQLTASLMRPDQAAGKQFWSQIYAKAKEKYGSTQIPVNTLNKVWILPDKATIYEHNGTAVIGESHLKVMLEQDYLALEKQYNNKDLSIGHQEEQKSSPMASALIREVILPQIEREVNEGRNFAGVRQVNNALILATWFKQNLKRSLLGQTYMNRNKVSGIDLQDRTVKQEIYQEYLSAFKKGVYNYIKEDIDPQTQLTVARKYFLGGWTAKSLQLRTQQASSAQISDNLGPHVLLASFAMAVMADKASVTKNSADERLVQIRESGYQGFPIVSPDKDIPVGVQYALAFYDTQVSAENNPVRKLIREGKLRAGPDLTGSIEQVMEDGDGYLVPAGSENEVDQILIDKLSSHLLTGKFIEWKRKLRSAGNNVLFVHNSGVIAKPVEVLKRYGILDLLSTGEPVSMSDIVNHVRKLKIDGEKILYNTPNRQYIAGVLRSLASAGWLTIQNKSPLRLKFTLTPKGQQAIRVADRFAEVADFMPEFGKITDYLFNRPHAPQVKGSLEQLARSAQNNWGIPASTDPRTADEIKGQLNGYLAGNLALAFFLEKDTVEQNQVEGAGFNWNEIRTMLIQNHWSQIKRTASDKVVLIPNWKDRIKQMEDVFDAKFGIGTFQDKLLPILNQSVGIFDLFDSDLTVNLDEIRRIKHIQGNGDELKAAFDVFVNVGYLRDLGEGRYQKTQEGVVAFDRVLAYGVPFSYRPSYDLSEQFMFGDAQAIKRYDDNGNELLVYRYLNVLGSGAAHTTYFKQIDKIVREMVAERMEEIRKTPVSADNPFVLSFADTGSGDGTFLAHIYHVVMDTEYGDLVRNFKELYKIEMVGVDYNAEAQYATHERLELQDVPNQVMYGDIGDPKQIVRDVKMGLLNKYGRHDVIKISEFPKLGLAFQYLLERNFLKSVNETEVRINNFDIKEKDIENAAKEQANGGGWQPIADQLRSVLQKSLHANLMVIHTRTFLDHNRPWKEVQNVEQAKRRRSTSTGTYGWRGRYIPNNFIEQNLYEHDKGWADALREEGQKDLVVIELHTIAPEVAAQNIGKTLDVSYWLSHAFSDQFIIEFPIYQKMMKEAGFRPYPNKGFQMLYPPDKPSLTTVSIGVYELPKAAAMVANRVDHATVAEVRHGVDPSDPFGGINLNPDLDFLRVERDAHGDQLPMEMDNAMVQNNKIKGIQPVLLKIVPYDKQSLAV